MSTSDTSMPDKAATVHVEANTLKHMAEKHPKFMGIVDEAQAATAKEHSMTLWQALKTYPKAIGWSVLLSTAIIMEGYDVVLMATFYGFPAFNQKFGVQLPDGSYQLQAKWQA